MVPERAPVTMNAFHQDAPCSECDVTRFDFISSVVAILYGTTINGRWKIIVGPSGVRTLQIAMQTVTLSSTQVLTIGNDKTYEIPRTELTDDSVALQDGIDNMTIEDY